MPKNPLQPKQKPQNERGYVWAAIVYPDSAKSTWRQDLKNMCDRLLISPLHDSDADDEQIDVNTAPKGSYTVKKPHYHVILAFGSLKSYNQIQPLITAITTVKKIEKVMSTEGAVRYLIHADHPHKYQYNRADIEDYGSCAKMRSALSDYFVRQIGKGEKIDIMFDIKHFIEKYKIYQFTMLLDYCEVFQREWGELIFNEKTYAIKQLLKSEYDTEFKKQKLEARAELKCDSSNAAVIALAEDKMLDIFADTSRIIDGAIKSKKELPL